MISSIILILVFTSQLISIQPQEKFQRIVNGYVAEAGEFPFFVLLRITESDGTMASCGATLISQLWLLTAAHCIYDSKSLVAHFENETVQVDKANFHVHFWWLKILGWNDVALIRLPKSIQFSKHTQPVQLPSDCEVPQNVPVIAIGKGATSDSTKISRQLHFAELTTLSLSECRKIFPFLLFRKSVICAQNSANLQSICRGDSGSALISKTKGTMIGIASMMRRGGCEEGTAQAFTSVYSYLDWISEITGLNLPDC